MNINFTARHFRVPDDLRDYAQSSSTNGFKSIDGCIESFSSKIIKIVDQWKKHR